MKKNRSMLLSSLKQQNENLRTNLKRLSSELDIVIDRVIKRPDPQQETQITEIENKSRATYYSRISMISKEINTLQKRAKLDPYQKQLALENERKDLTAKIKATSLELRSLKKQENEKPRENKNEIQILLKELKQVQADLKETSDKYTRDSAFNQNTKQRIQELEDELAKTSKELSPREIEPEEYDIRQELKQELLDLIKQKKQIRNKYAKIAQNVKDKAEVQANTNSIFKSQISLYDKSAKNIESQLRVMRQTIKNLSRNPKVPDLSSSELVP